MKKITIITIAFLFFITGCGKNRNIDQLDNAIYEVDLDKLENKSTGKMSLYFKSVTPIFLETNDSCLIRQVDGIQVSGDYLFILDRKSRNLFSFNKKGKLAGKIGNMGRGPGEYGYISDFTIDSQNNIIYIYDTNNSKIQSYNFNGEFIKSIPIDEQMHLKTAHLQYTDKGFFADYGFFGAPTEGDNPLLINLQTQSGKIEKKFLSSSKDNMGFQLIVYKDLGYFYCRNGEKPCYSPLYSNTIYSLSNHVKPYFRLKSNRVLKKEDLKGFDSNDVDYLSNIPHLNKISSIQNFFEIGSYLICDYLDYYYKRTVIYNKETQKSSLYDILFDDLFYNSPNEYVYHYLGCADEKGIYAYTRLDDMPKLIEYLKNGFVSYAFDDEELECINNTSDDSNPILFYYEMK
jgi:hypothetical protein